MPSDSGQSITWTLVVVAHVGCQKHADSPAGASLKITSPPYARNAVGQQQRAAEVVISRPETLSVQSAGLSVPGLPSTKSAVKRTATTARGRKPTKAPLRLGSAPIRP